MNFSSLSMYNWLSHFFEGTQRISKNSKSFFWAETCWTLLKWPKEVCKKNIFFGRCRSVPVWFCPVPEVCMHRKNTNLVPMDSPWSGLQSNFSVFDFEVPTRKFSISKFSNWQSDYKYPPKPNFCFTHFVAHKNLHNLATKVFC